MLPNDFSNQYFIMSVACNQRHIKPTILYFEKVRDTNKASITTVKEAKAVSTLDKIEAEMARSTVPMGWLSGVVVASLV